MTRYEMITIACFNCDKEKSIPKKHLCLQAIRWEGGAENEPRAAASRYIRNHDIVTKKRIKKEVDEIIARANAATRERMAHVLRLMELNGDISPLDPREK